MELREQLGPGDMPESDAPTGAFARSYPCRAVDGT